MKKTRIIPNLHLPLAAAGITKAFTKVAVLNGYLTLADLLAIRLTNFVGMKWFKPAMLVELSDKIKQR